jgi:hypothetical protein
MKSGTSAIGSELIASFEGGRVVLEPRRLTSSKKLVDWLPDMQVSPPPAKVDLNADVESYTEE